VTTSTVPSWRTPNPPHRYTHTAYRSSPFGVRHYHATASHSHASLQTPHSHIKLAPANSTASHHLSLLAVSFTHLRCCFANSSCQRHVRDFFIRGLSWICPARAVSRLAVADRYAVLLGRTNLVADGLLWTHDGSRFWPSPLASAWIRSIYIRALHLIARQCSFLRQSISGTLHNGSCVASHSFLGRPGDPVCLGWLAR